MNVDIVTGIIMSHNTGVSGDRKQSWHLGLHVLCGMYLCEESLSFSAPGYTGIEDPFA